jgi:hypothetical protein
MIISVSLKFETSPSELIPRVKYRVPARYRDLRDTIPNVNRFPLITADLNSKTSGGDGVGQVASGQIISLFCFFYERGGRGRANIQKSPVK